MSRLDSSIASSDGDVNYSKDISGNKFQSTLTTRANENEEEQDGDDVYNSRLEELKECFESNIYTRIAGTEDGGLFMGFLIASLQLFIPIRIIVDNKQNYEQCKMFGLLTIITNIMRYCISFVSSFIFINNGDNENDYLTNTNNNDSSGATQFINCSFLDNPDYISFFGIEIPIHNSLWSSACAVRESMIMSWDTIIIGTALMYLLWLTIINDTINSIGGFEYVMGLQNIPRKWAVYVGMIITPLANCLIGVAACVVFLNADVTVIEVAKDSMSLFSIIRLDEEFGALHSMVTVLKRRFARYNAKNSIERSSNTNGNNNNNNNNNNNSSRSNNSSNSLNGNDNKPKSDSRKYSNGDKMNDESNTNDDKNSKGDKNTDNFDNTDIPDYDENFNTNITDSNNTSHFLKYQQQRQPYENEEDDETAERLLRMYGPWIETPEYSIVRWTVYHLEVICFLAAFSLPFLYLACAL